MVSLTGVCAELATESSGPPCLQSFGLPFCSVSCFVPLRSVMFWSVLFCSVLFGSAVLFCSGPLCWAAVAGTGSAWVD